MAKTMLPRGGDIAFLRRTAVDLTGIRAQRRDADQRIERIRWEIVTRIERALWNRYRKYHFRVEDPPSYHEWLLSEGNLVNTYHHHSYHTRLRWVYRIIQTAKVPELALFGESKGEWGAWYFDQLKILINRRQPSSGFILGVGEDMVNDEHFVESVPIVVFSKIDEELTELVAIE